MARRNEERGERRNREEERDSEIVEKLVHINRVAATVKGGRRFSFAALLVAERALEKGVKDVVFDRGGYIYHGRVKALADAAREAGLNF